MQKNQEGPSDPLDKNIKQMLKKLDQNEEVAFLKLRVPQKLNKFKYFLNRQTVITLISIIVLILIYFIIYRYYMRFISISTLIITPLLTLLFLIIRENYIFQNRQETILFGFSNELIRNYENLLNSRSKINHSLSYKNVNEINYAPLHKVQLEMYNLLKQLFPEKLIYIGHFKLEIYVGRSLEINELIRTRELVATHRHVNLENYIKSVEIIDNQLMENINDMIEFIPTIDSKVKFIELKSEDLHNFTKKEYYMSFLKSHKISEKLLPIKIFEYITEKNPLELHIIILYT